MKLYELEQLTLFSNVPDGIYGVEFPLGGGGCYRVVERWGSWDRIFCSFFNGETAYMWQTVFRTNQAAHQLAKAV
jgi:hypothetical protein